MYTSFRAKPSSTYTETEPPPAEKRQSEEEGPSWLLQLFEVLKRETALFEDWKDPTSLRMHKWIADTLVLEKSDEKGLFERIDKLRALLINPMTENELLKDPFLLGDEVKELNDLLKEDLEKAKPHTFAKKMLFWILQAEAKDQHAGFHSDAEYASFWEGFQAEFQAEFERFKEANEEALKRSRDREQYNENLFSAAKEWYNAKKEQDRREVEELERLKEELAALKRRLSETKLRGDQVLNEVRRMQEELRALEERYARALRRKRRPWYKF